MGDIRIIHPVKFFCGILHTPAFPWAEIEPRLTGLLGPLETISPAWHFDCTDYYEAEMGKGAIRRFVSFSDLAHTGELPGLKIRTNQLESELAGLLPGMPPRPVNLDPGYLDLVKVVLASTKGHSHRLHLADGIFGEVTLQWHRGSGWDPLPWTFPDYASGRYSSFLDALRIRYVQQLKEEGT